MRRSIHAALLLCVISVPALAAASSNPDKPSEFIFIAQVVLLLLTGRALGEVMQRIGQPAILGQLLAGIALGPSLLGVLAPEFHAAVFPASAAQHAMLDAASQLGILLLLLLTGMEVDLPLILRMGRAAAAISICGIAIPFAAGVALGELLPEWFLPQPELRLVTSLFLGTTLAISSVKIVAAVVREMNFLRRTLGQLMVAAAIVDDTIGWIIIAVIFGIALHGGVDLVSLSTVVAATLAFLGISLTIGQRVVATAMRWSNDRMESELPVITVILVIMGTMALITDAIGVHSVLGAFVAGVLVGRSPILTTHVRDQLRGATVALFMPIFFGVAGLGADLRVLADPSLLMATVAFILIASIGKFAGAFAGGELAGLTIRESLALGCGMNARGSTEVIVASIGLSIGALNQELYTMIVAMAFITTMAMPPSLRWALGRIPLGEAEAERLAREEIESKGFLGNVERLLLAVDDSPDGRFVARLGGILSAWRRIPVTVLAVDRPAPVAREAAAMVQEGADAAAEGPARKHDIITAPAAADSEAAVATEARKGYGLMLVGVGTAMAAQQEGNEASADLATAFAGPVGLVDARGAHRNDPTGSTLNILVPVAGTQESGRALEVALALARAGSSAVTLMHVVPSGTRSLVSPRFVLEQGVLKQAVDLAEVFDVPTRTVIRRGMSPAEAILYQLQRGGHDLVILGVRSRTGTPLSFGDAAAAVLERSEASVMLVAGPSA